MQYHALVIVASLVAAEVASQVGASRVVAQVASQAVEVSQAVEA